MRVSKEKINLLNRVFPHKVIFPELTEVTKVTEVGGIMELWSAKGECRSREFARFSFVLSVAETTIYKIYYSLSALVCSNRASRFGYKYARKKESQRSARERVSPRVCILTLSTAI